LILGVIPAKAGTQSMRSVLLIVSAKAAIQQRFEIKFGPGLRRGDMK
jgi:hypothetical protein